MVILLLWVRVSISQTKICEIIFTYELQYTQSYFLCVRNFKRRHHFSQVFASVASSRSFGDGDDDPLMTLPWWDLEPKPLLSAETVNKGDDDDDGEDRDILNASDDPNYAREARSIEAEFRSNGGGGGVSVCGGNYYNIVLGETGKITTPNYPGNYEPNQSCMWKFKVSRFSRKADKNYKSLIYFIVYRLLTLPRSL